MSNHTHDLDQALDEAIHYPDHYLDNPAHNLGKLAAAAGTAITNILESADDRYDDDAQQSLREDACVMLADVAGLAASWARQPLECDLTHIWEAIRKEYDRAHTKHDGNTPANPNMSDMHRAAILLEEVGEVARALTPDAKTPVGHAGNLADELIQTATMAAAWLQHLIDQEEAEA